MSEYIVAARHKDGTKNLYAVSEVENHEEAREYIHKSINPRAILVCLEGGKQAEALPTDIKEIA